MILRAEEIALATGGVLRRDGPPGSIATDSRRLDAGDWFVALVGERHDGHDHLQAAQASGCAGAVASRVPAGWAQGWVEVPDTLRALQELARFVRDGFPGPVVGITGSAGKTTTRAMCALVCEALGPVHQTEGNLNNHVGLPITVLRAPVDAAVWVLEMGMSHAGEIALLQDVGKPNVRLITNVGAAHLEGVGSIEGVARAKGELFDGARPGDTCCVNGDDPYVAGLPLPDSVRVLRYGSSHACDVRLTDTAIDPDTLATRFRVETPDGVVLGALDSPGLHLAMDACAAIAVGVALRIPADGMAARLQRYEPVGMRLRLEAGPGGLRVINDAYNANPLSMAAALRTLAALSGARRVALLGDMLELGAAEADAHREMLELARALGLDLVGLCGPRFAALAGPCEVAAPDAPALAEAVRDRLRPGDVVLIKGSRGMQMERVLQVLGSGALAPGSGR